MDGSKSLLSVTQMVYTLVFQLIPCTGRPSLPPFLCEEISTRCTLENFPATTVLFKALSLLPLFSHRTSLKHHPSAILHGSESLHIQSLMAQRWLTFRLTLLLMNSCSHHYCLSSLLKPALCWRGFRDEESEDCQLIGVGESEAW